MGWVPGVCSENEPDEAHRCKGRIFKDYPSSNGFINVYKIFCIDVDGIGIGEDPFGYGIRYDGKIMPSARANEWLNKSIQNKD